ncbi:MAG: Trk system potassium transporter TrkA [Treponema sp.]|nr:MAG: Trk system potassium transporter TrkA [Treponema sp.]
MNVIIVGAGVTGTELARSLIGKNHNVVLIESREETARHAANRLDCMVINDAGNKTDILRDAGIEKADALVALTDSDEINLIICGIVQSMAPKVFKIARVRNDDYLYTFKQCKEQLLGVDVLVFPDEEAANSIIKAIEHGAVSDIISFQDSKYEIARFQVHEKSVLVGKNIKELQENIDFSFVVVAIEENGNCIIPSGSTVLNSGSKISVLTESENIASFYMLAGFKVKPFNKIVIVGMGRIGMILAEYLFKTCCLNFFQKFILRKITSKNIIIVEKDEAKAKVVSAKFPDATVYNADITNEAFIEEASLDEADLVITATQNFEANMIGAALLKSLGVSNTISLVQSSVMESIAYKLGIDVAVSFKGSVADAIISYLSGKTVKTVHTMADGALEIVELVITENSRMIDKPLKNFAEHGRFLFLLIQRDTESIIPDGNTKVLPGDRIVFIAKPSESRRITEIVSGEK